MSDLVTSRAAVRTSLMRSTLHLVSARDCLGIRPLVQPRQERELLATWGERLAGADPAQVAQEGRKLVEQEPRTLAELATLLGERWPEATGCAVGRRAG